jgi:hypothetical protein
MRAAIETILGEESSAAETNSCETSTWAGPLRLGVARAAGSGVLAVQQLVFAVRFDSGAGAQQLCSFRCARCIQAANGATIAPTSRIDITARWKAPRTMASEYHACRPLL